MLEPVEVVGDWARGPRAMNLFRQSLGLDLACVTARCCGTRRTWVHWRVGSLMDVSEATFKRFRRVTIAVCMFASLTATGLLTHGYMNHMGRAYLATAIIWALAYFLIAQVGKLRPGHEHGSH
jgi:hypothetical protein